MLHRKVFNGLGLYRLPLPRGRGNTIGLFHSTFPEVVPRLGRGTRYVMTVHDCLAARHPELLPVRTVAAFRRSVSWAVKVNATFLTVSHFTKAELCDLFPVQPEKVIVAHNGVTHIPVERVSIGGSGQTSDRRYLLYLGNLEPRKGLPDLVDAYIRSGLAPDVRLIIAGRALWKSDHLLDAASDAIDAGDIAVLGHVSDAERHRLIQNAVALCYPSQYEGFGIPPLEAMRLGTPAICYRTQVAEEVLGDAAMLVDIGDVEGLARSIESVANDDEVRYLFARRGVKRAESFTWEHSAESTLLAYRAALG